MPPKPAKPSKSNEKNKAPVAVEQEEVVEAPPPEPVPAPPPPVSKNIERVLIPKPQAKVVISHHSGTILAQPDPVVQLSEEQRQKAREAFQSIAGELPAVASDQLVDLLQTLFPHLDKAKALPSIAEVFPNPPERVEEEVFLAFLARFLAPAFEFGQHLRLFASRGCIEEVKKLALRQCPVGCGDGEGMTAFHHACEYDRVDVLDALLDLLREGPNAQAALEEVLNRADRYGWTPLHCAAHRGSLQCVQRLLDCRVQLRTATAEGKTACHLAAAQNHANVVFALLKVDPELVQMADGAGMTVLHEASYRGHLSLFQELSKHSKADLGKKDRLGRLPAAYLDISLD